MMETPTLAPCWEDENEWHVFDLAGEMYVYYDFADAIRVFLGFVEDYRYRAGMTGEEPETAHEGKENAR